MAKTKGVSFVNAKAFCDERRADAWQKVVAALPEADRDALQSLLAMGWYDLGLYARLLHAIDGALGRGDLALMAPLGRFGAERDLTTVQKLFFRLSNPAYAIEKTAEYWRRFHDTGTWVLSRPNDTSVAGTLEGWGGVDRALCAELMGYMPRVIELVGGKDAVMVHPRCRARGASTCEFSLSWQR